MQRTIGGRKACEASLYCQVLRLEAAKLVRLLPEWCSTGVAMLEAGECRLSKVDENRPCTTKLVVFWW